MPLPLLQDLTVTQFVGTLYLRLSEGLNSVVQWLN